MRMKIIRPVLVASLLVAGVSFFACAEEKQPSAQKQDVPVEVKKEAEGYATNVVVEKELERQSLIEDVKNEKSVIPVEESVTAAEPAKKPTHIPTTVDADNIEYSQDRTVLTMSGNVKITKEGDVLTCDKAVYDTTTNEAKAEGNVVFKDKKGIIKAKNFDYNLKTKMGEGYDVHIFCPPYYGAGQTMKKISENEIEMKNGYITTCDKDHPHYRLQSRLIYIVPNEKVTIKAMTFRVANTPIIYFPKYSQNLKDDRMHVLVTPGNSKDWGLFLLTAWRYDLLPNSGGRINLDLRERRNVAFGFDNYYDTKVIGKGYFRAYYMLERKFWFKRFYQQLYDDHKGKSTIEKDRFRYDWRHKFEVDKDTYMLAEFHKVRDANFIKDYFFREYEKDSNESTYFLFNRNFPNQIGTLNFLMQKRVNRIFPETETLPQVIFTKADTKILNTPLYFSSNTSYTNYNQKYPAPSDETSHNQTTNTYLRLSLPFSFFYVVMNPYAGTRETYYSRMVNKNQGAFREVWDSGISMSTRFYRIFDVDKDILGMELNKLRHVIIPNVSYSYTHPPTLPPSKVVNFDGTVTEQNQMSLSLENKLQTKRKDKTVDFLRFIVSTNYLFNIEGRRRRWDDNITLDLESQLTDTLRLESKDTYSRKERVFTNANFDLWGSAKDITWGTGYRYARKSSSQFTGEVTCNILKGWSFRVYERFQFMGNTLVKEQNYSITKDLHCWLLEVNYNVLRNVGETIWFAISLKAFPEMSLDYNQSYHQPKPGSQGYQNL